jgi:hypothetical protein
MSNGLGSWECLSVVSDRLRAFSRNLHCHTSAVLRTFRAIDFAPDRCKRHGRPALSLKNLRWENFRWTGLGQKT